MTRKEGIIRSWQNKNKRLPMTPKQQDQLLAFEYNNYLELCDACLEMPVKYNDWINQPITPKKINHEKDN